MEINKRILIIGLILIFISMIFSIGFVLYSKLDNPVFLLNYAQYHIPYDDEYYGDREFVLQYITNIDDKRKVESISFKEAPDVEFYASEYGSGRGSFFIFNGGGDNEEIYGRYVVRPIFIKLSSEKQFDEIELNNVKIRFNNGDEMEANIGRIILYTDRSEENFLEHSSGGGSSDGTSYTYLEVKEDIILINVEFPILDEVEDFIELEIGGKNHLDISGVKYNKGDRLLINTKFNKPDDILSQYTLYDIRPKLYYKDVEGNIYNRIINNIHHFPYRFDFKGMFKYLKARGEI